MDCDVEMRDKPKSEIFERWWWMWFFGECEIDNMKTTGAFSITLELLLF